MSKINLIDEIYWGFHRQPSVKARNYYEEVDPFPCYHHDLDRVEGVVDRVQEVFPIDPKRGPIWNILAFEDMSRTNGATGTGFDYAELEADGTYAWHIVISLNGKRTPIHPAMTRFVTAHEYGHGLEQVIEAQKFEKKGNDQLLKEYATLRGLEWSDEPYGAGTWHKAVGEIFADDFRIVLAGIEREHWPHPDISRPEEVSTIVEWWHGAKEVYSYKAPDVTTFQPVE